MERIINKDDQAAKKAAFLQSVDKIKLQALRTGAIIMWRAVNIYLSRNEITTSKPLNQDDIFRIWDELTNPPKSNLIVPQTKIIKP